MAGLHICNYRGVHGASDFSILLYLERHQPLFTMFQSMGGKINLAVAFSAFVHEDDLFDKYWSLFLWVFALRMSL